MVAFLASRNTLFAARIGLAGENSAMTELTARLSALSVRHKTVRHEDELADCDLVTLPAGWSGDPGSRLRDRALRDGFLHVGAAPYGAFGLLARPAIDIDVIFLERFLAEQALIVAGQRVLDIGWQPLRPRDFTPRDVHWLALPPTPRIVRMLGEHLGERTRSLTLRPADGLSPDRLVATGTAFDVVLCHGLLHHMPDTDPALRILRRLVAPDGVVMASVSHPLRVEPTSKRTPDQYLPAFERLGFEVEAVSDTTGAFRWIEGAVRTVPQLQVFRLRPEPTTGPRRCPPRTDRPRGLP
ncbi:class I SAM-dependent methyltransferase [Streptomyces canus]|uniref:class I SAM-dependent methyltransferase n=1 Tax=Streptomyces canus TaxID=58343 RepID=UPI0030E3F8EB